MPAPVALAASARARNADTRVPSSETSVIRSASSAPPAIGGMAGIGGRESWSKHMAVVLASRDRGVIGPAHHPAVDGIRFGRAVVALRKRHGWTQSELALRCRLARSTLGRIERGQIARIAHGDLETVARTL